MVFSSDPVLRIQEATIFQGQNSVLDNISFEIEKGEFVLSLDEPAQENLLFLKPFTQTYLCDWVTLM